MCYFIFKTVCSLQCVSVIAVTTPYYFWNHHRNKHIEMKELASKHKQSHETHNILSWHHDPRSLQQQHDSFCDMAPVKCAVHLLGFYGTMSCRSRPDIEKTQAHIAPHLACHVHWLLRGHWVCFDGLPLQTEQCKKPERKTTCRPSEEKKKMSNVGECLCACTHACLQGHVWCLCV